MKHSIFRVFLTLYCMHATTSCMDIEPVYKPVKKTTPTESKMVIETIVNTIDGALDKKYKSQTNVFGTLPTQHMSAVISMVNGSFKAITPTNDFIAKIYAQNNLFKQSVDHFSALARKELDNVTIDMLTTMQQFKCTPQLQELPQPIAAYIMHCVRNTMQSTYEMTFSDHHQSIMSYDLCPHTNQAATTGQDKTLRIYSLNQGKQVFVRYEKKPMTAVCFNNDGTQLATLVRPSVIKIWDPHKQTCLHFIDILHSAYHYLSYNERIAQSILSVCVAMEMETEIKDVILQWDVSKQKPQPLGIIPLGADPGEDKNYLTKKNYTLTPHYLDKTSFTVTKTGCFSFCTLKKAVENTQDIRKLNTIEYLQIYNDLTDYEKSMILQSKINKAEKLIKQPSTEQKTQTCQQTRLLSPTQY